MNYSKTIWKDHAVQYPRRYRITNNSDGTVDLTPAYGTVRQTGTPLNADNLNHIEDAIDLLAKGGGSVRITVTDDGAGNVTMRIG